jgi:hypothetical protein
MSSEQTARERQMPETHWLSEFSPLTSALIGNDLSLQRIDLALVVVALKLHYVSNRYYSYQLTLLHNRQMSKSVLGHSVRNRHQIILWQANNDLFGH